MRFSLYFSAVITSADLSTDLYGPLISKILSSTLFYVLHSSTCSFLQSFHFCEFSLQLLRPLFTLPFPPTAEMSKLKNCREPEIFRGLSVFLSFLQNSAIFPCGSLYSALSFKVLPDSFVFTIFLALTRYAAHYSAISLLFRLLLPTASLRFVMPSVPFLSPIYSFLPPVLSGHTFFYHVYIITSILRVLFLPFQAYCLVPLPPTSYLPWCNATLCCGSVFYLYCQSPSPLCSQSLSVFCPWAATLQPTVPRALVIARAGFSVVAKFPWKAAFNCFCLLLYHECLLIFWILFVVALWLPSDIFELSAPFSLLQSIPTLLLLSFSLSPSVLLPAPTRKVFILLLPCVGIPLYSSLQLLSIAFYFTVSPWVSPDSVLSRLLPPMLSCLLFYHIILERPRCVLYRS